jgi:hypothetical protein
LIATPAVRGELVVADRGDDAQEPLEVVEPHDCAGQPFPGLDDLSQSRAVYWHEQVVNGTQPPQRGRAAGPGHRS